MKQVRRKNFYKILSLLLIISLLHLTVRCKYFKVKEPAPTELAEVAKIDEQFNYFVIHSNDSTYALNNIQLDSTAISGTITKLDTTIWYEKDRSTRIKSMEQSIIHEVHIYLQEGYDEISMGEQETIPLEYLKEIRVIDPDTGATVASHVLGTAGVLAGAFVIVLIIALLTKSSCPYIYSYNGETFVFEGEIFGGAIMQNLQRQDYIPLPALKVENNQVKLRINNELKEKHFIDLANLMVINHPEASRVLVDSDGRPRLISEPKKPIESTSLKGSDLIPSVLNKDQNSVMFNEDNENTNGVILKFENDPAVNEAKLVITAKNSLWLDYIFTKFTEKFGGYFDNWMQKQSEMPANKRLERTIAEGFPLTISVFKNNAWQVVEQIPTVGPLAMRDFVVPFNSNDIEGDILVKLETSFMFWELDYAALDFSQDERMHVSRIVPNEVASTDKLDWKKALRRTDGNYMVQPAPGMIAELTFNLEPEKNEQQQSYFLHTEGYYELIRNYRGLPKINELKKFKEVGYFAEYSRLLYNSIHQEKLPIAHFDVN